MRRTWLAAALLSVASAPAAAEIRAVFVGVDDYKYAGPGFPRAGFRDLSGAVNDVARIKRAFRDAYGLDLDREQAGDCQSANDVSITLTSLCATRANIIDAWNQQIDASQPGDTVIFYFAGHGSRYIEAVGSEQASGFNSTIMPTDARQPGSPTSADILDREIRLIIDRANGAGVRVVTIFDSCNSGTATRSGAAEARTAPALVVGQAQPLPPPAASGSLGAYRVHFAGAQDGEEAFESGSVGSRNGLFTDAFAKTLVRLRGASFADIAAATRAEMALNPAAKQQPHAEGALRATLGGDEVRVPIFDAARTAQGITIAGGTLTGITRGSRFVLYPSVSEALPGTTRPLATGTVTGVGPAQALLTLDAPAELTGRLVAREIAHRFETAVGISVQGNNPALTAALAAIPYARPVNRPQLVIAPGAGGTVLRTAGGRLLTRLPVPEDPAFAFLLERVIGKIGRANALMALATPDRKAGISFCIQPLTDEADPESCPPGGPAGPSLAVNEKTLLTVKNTAAGKRFLYVLVIDQDYAIDVLLPPRSAIDEALGMGDLLRVPEGQEPKPTTPGIYRFLTLSTDAQINAIALEQTGLATVDREACLTALTRQQCANITTTRDVVMPKVVNWSANLATVEVK